MFPTFTHAIDKKELHEQPLIMTENSSKHAADLGSVQLTNPENCVEYFLFVIDHDLEPRKKLAQLENVRQNTLRHTQDLTKNYIWQREEFTLELRTDKGMLALRQVVSSPIANVV